MWDSVGIPKTSGRTQALNSEHGIEARVPGRPAVPPGIRSPDGLTKTMLALVAGEPDCDRHRVRASGFYRGHPPQDFVRTQIWRQPAETALPGLATAMVVV